MTTANGNAPSFKPNKGMRFYNASERICEAIQFSMPGTVGRDTGNLLANWTLDVAEKSFFQVPTAIKLMSDNTSINVDFPTTVLQRFKDRGVILIDDEWETPEDQDRADAVPIAKTDEEAKEKGERIWRAYLVRIVRTHIESCDHARAVGGFPREAIGFTKRAFKLLNMIDPAEKGFESYRAAQATAPAASSELQSAEAQQIRAELAQTKQMLQKVLSALSAKEEQDLNEEIERTTSIAAEIEQPEPPRKTAPARSTAPMRRATAPAH